MSVLYSSAPLATIMEVVRSRNTQSLPFYLILTTLLMTRTQAILELLQANISLLLVDADHFWAKDPLPWLDEQVICTIPSGLSIYILRLHTMGYLTSVTNKDVIIQEPPGLRHCVRR